MHPATPISTLCYPLSLESTSSTACYMFTSLPVIDSFPSIVTCGGTPFTIIAKVPVSGTNLQDLRVTMIRARAVKHSFDFDQRYMELPFVAQLIDDPTVVHLTVTPPPDGTHAPPGYYMLFVCDGSIPSVGKVVHVR